MATEMRWADEHVISPELVLVSSPEEARRARASLPAEPWMRPTAVAAPALRVVEVGAPQPRPALRLVETSPAEPSPRRLRSLVPTVALLAVLAAGGVFAERLLLGGPHTGTAFVASSAFVPSRAWSWAPRPGASAYEVTFYRDGRIVLRARTSENRLALQRGFRFEAGQYRWTVEPIPLTQGEPPIVDASFALSAAAADAANTG